jgi:hypothetical protein
VYILLKTIKEEGGQRNLVTLVHILFLGACAINDQLLDQQLFSSAIDSNIVFWGFCYCCLLGVGLGPALELCIAINPR